VTARSEAASVAAPAVVRVWSRNYSLFILGLVVSNIGTWAQRVAQSWLVLDISGGSGTALGITTGLQFLPVLLLGAWGGVVVDRLPRRQLVAATQAGAAGSRSVRRPLAISTRVLIGPTVNPSQSIVHAPWPTTPRPAPANRNLGSG
jgi:hypothetical protein